jgi:Zn-dependent M32 family carboxypeptidase
VNVHAHGAMLDLDGVLVAATGHPLDPQAFHAHLQARYAGNN